MGTDIKVRARFLMLKDMGLLATAEENPALGAGEEAEAGRPAPAHVFSAHTPLWAYEDPYYARPDVTPAARPVFETLPPESGLDEALAKTRLVVFVGAALSPQLRRCLAEPGVFALVFEHDPERLGRFLLQADPAGLSGKALVCLGEPDAFSPPLSALLDTRFFALGFPVFFVPEGAGEKEQAFGARVREYVEVLFFRHRVYPLSSQSLSRSIPFRNIARELFYDQQAHAYENMIDWATRPDISLLHGLFAGETAILVAAGADLAKRLDFLRKNADRAVLIAVNSALRTLVEAGIKPHFAVANDTSLAVARSYAGLPKLRPVILAAHCLSHLGGEVFPKKFLFGNYRPELFGARPELRLHGSVLTTAFSLARHLGCSACVLVGAQLSSADPWSLQYVGGQRGRGEAPAQALTHGWPQLYPVTNRWGRQRYTSLNFLDVKHWLTEEIRASGMRVVNTTDETIIDTNADYDPAPEIAPTGRLAASLKQAHAAERRSVNLDVVVSYAQGEEARYRACAELMTSLNGLEGEAFLKRAWEILAVFDRNNVSYLVQRYKNFDQNLFYRDLHVNEDSESVYHGMETYYSHVCDMLGTLLGLLARQKARLAAMRGGRGG